MTIEMNLKNHLKPLSFSLPIIVILGVMAYLLQLNVNGVLTSIIFYGLFFIPSLYLHLEYYFYNRGQRLEISTNQLVFQKRDKTIQQVTFSNIEKIILGKSANLDKGGIQFIPIDSYHYARIIPKNGNDIIITSLLTPDVEKILKTYGLSYSREKRLFSTINYFI